GEGLDAGHLAAAPASAAACGPNARPVRPRRLSAAAGERPPRLVRLVALVRLPLARGLVAGGGALLAGGRPSVLQAELHPRGSPPGQGPRPGRGGGGGPGSRSSPPAGPRWTRWSSGSPAARRRAASATSFNAWASC